MFSITCTLVCFTQLLCLLSSLASQRHVLRGNASRASKTLSQKPHAICVHHIYLYVVFRRHSKAICLCATFKTFKKLLLVLCNLQLMGNQSKKIIAVKIMQLISCLLCDNHVVMGNAINVSLLLNIMFYHAMNVHLVRNNWGCHVQIGVCIFVREEQWAANRSHAHMVEVSAGQLNPQISSEIILLLNALSINPRSPTICFLCFPGMDVQVEIFQNREIKCDLSP